MDKEKIKFYLKTAVALLAAFIGGNVTPKVVPVDNKVEVTVLDKTKFKSWIPTDGQGRVISAKCLEEVASTLKDDTYGVLGLPNEGEQFLPRLISVTTLTAYVPRVAPTPKVVPAPITPTVNPNPPVVVVPSKGKREIVILREKQSDSDDLNNQFISMRVGEFASYLNINGHSLEIYDDDAKLPDGSPDPYVQGLLRQLGQIQMPTVFYIDKDANKVLDVKKFGGKEKVMEELKAVGG